MNERLKQYVASLLRATRLLPLGDLPLYLIDQAKYARSNKQFSRAHPNFPIPPKDIAFEAFNTTSAQAYWDYGRRTAPVFAELITRYKGSKALRVLDWGCGPARVIRHLPALMPTSELHGHDYNTKTVQWCYENISGIHFKTNGPRPPLQMRDNSVDVVYTISVFTHMSEAFQLEWMAELGRVLVPGGLLIFTTHGEEKRYKLFGSELSAFDEGRLVVKANYIEGKKHTLAYHPNEYVETRMLGEVDLLEHLDSDAGHGVGQNIWVARMC